MRLQSVRGGSADQHSLHAPTSYHIPPETPSSTYAPHVSVFFSPNPAPLVTSRSATYCHRIRNVTGTDAQPFLDENGAPASLPEMGDGGEQGKLRVLLGLLKK